MFVDARQLDDGSEIRGRIAIIGAGAAGITLALELAKRFKDVLLLESGGFEFEPKTQNLYEGPLLGIKNAGPLSTLATSRLRFLGGTTNHWGGQCSLLDPIDFYTRADWPFSGWPFKLDELVPFYRRAFTYCEIGAFQDRSAFVDQAEPIAHQLFESPDLELTEFRYSPPTRFGEHFRQELASSNDLKVILNANVTDIVMSSDGRAVTGLGIRTLSGRHLTASADNYILCCGGIENPRILLNCTRFFPRGIGNEYDLVGRFFMDHLWIIAGRIFPADEHFDLGPIGYRAADDNGVPITIAPKLTEETTRRRGRGACSLIPYPEFAESKATDSPAFRAFLEMVKDVGGGRVPANLEERTCEVLDAPLSMAAGLYYRSTDFIRNKSPLKAILVTLEGEQAPNPDSRVVLIEDEDALGMKRVGLDWQITDDDYGNLYQTALTLAQGVGAAGFGRMALEMQPDRGSSIHTCWHHMGTTRMHEDKTQGVVNADCQVHGIANLFIAGCSVFPTGGRVNPTLTIVALAIRLADHLKATSGT
jgi:choline dehydrogenase-like flavoprotein